MLSILTCAGFKIIDIIDFKTENINFDVKTNLFEQEATGDQEMTAILTITQKKQDCIWVIQSTC